MKNSFQSLNDQFRETMTQFLWEQWSRIGMAGNLRSKQSLDFIVDPEALLLATTRFASQEARFMGEILDWLLSNGKDLIAQRIKNLQTLYQYGCLPVLLEIDEILRRERPRDWSSLESLEKSSHEKVSGRSLAKVMELRGMSTRPNPESQEAFIFTLRSLFGGNARVEVIAWLVTHRRGYPAEISREVGWKSKSVQLILNDLEDAGMVYSERLDREKHFWVDKQRWLGFLRPKEDYEPRAALKWKNQPALYLGCFYIARILDRLVELEDTSERVKSVTIREMMGERISREFASMTIAFEMAGYGHLFQGHSRRSGNDLVQLFRAGVETIIAELRVCYSSQLAK